MSGNYRGYLYGSWTATSVTPSLTTGWTDSPPQDGDAIYIGLSIDLSTQNVTPSDPTAWTLLGDGTIANPDAETIVWFKLNNKYNSASPPNTQFNNAGSNAGVFVMVAASGVDPTLTPSIAIVTSNTSSNASPITINLNGGTSNNGDFGMVFLSLDKTSSTDTYDTTFPVQYTKRGADFINSFAHIIVATIDNVVAGSVAPTLTSTLTAGSGFAGWSGFVLYVRASGPLITSQPAHTTKFLGDTATFNVLATGSGTLHYQWKRNGVNVGTDSNSYTTPTLDFSYNSSIYTVDVTDDNGTTVSDNALLTVIYSGVLGWFKA
jgi:hypothetical protein